MEKAHPLVLDLFLQILDAGRITVATGETLDLTEFYIVATSNIGASNLMEMSETVPFRTLERVVFEQVDQQPVSYTHLDVYKRQVLMIIPI